jgi:hypothetical protein
LTLLPVGVYLTPGLHPLDDSSMSPTNISRHCQLPRVRNSGLLHTSYRCTAPPTCKAHDCRWSCFSHHSPRDLANTGLLSEACRSSIPSSSSCSSSGMGWRERRMAAEASLAVAPRALRTDLGPGQVSSFPHSLVREHHSGQLRD